MHLSRLLALGPSVVIEAWKIKVGAGVNSSCSSFKKRPDMLSGHVALFGFKADKRFFLIPSGCISICSRSGNGVGSTVGTLVVSFSVKKTDVSC